MSSTCGNVRFVVPMAVFMFWTGTVFAQPSFQGLGDLPGAEFDSIAFDVSVDGSIVAWGSNWAGQCNAPAPNADFVAVAAGYDHSLGLKANGSIVAWGDNDHGQCNLPVPNSGFIAVAAGGGQSFGLQGDGSIVAWGCVSDNNCGQCNVPAPNSGFTGVATGRCHSLGLKANGSIVGWGSNVFGQINVPAPNSGFKAVAAGAFHSLGLKGDGSIIAWGCGAPNNHFQCNVPAPNSGFTAVATGWYHSLGLKADGSIVGWGENGVGQTNVPAPNTGFVAVAAGYYHSLGLKADGSIVAWGGGTGQTDVPSPNMGFVAVAASGSHSLGLKADGPCCFTNGSCRQLRDNECHAQGGVFYGAGSDCESDRDGDSIADVCDKCPDDPYKTDPGICGCEIADTDSDGDTVADCHDNCPLPNPDQADCQPNGIGDICDIADGTSADVNLNSVPDECETCLFDADCGDALYCNGEETCQGGACTPGTAPCGNAEVCDEDGHACLPDCNGNGVPDSEDIVVGTSGDCDSDQIPDECELDDDVDGVVNDCDSCPGTPVGIIVGPDGCPVPFGPCCFGSVICIDATDSVDCQRVHGSYLGDGLTCGGDADGDGITACGDMCPLDPHKVAPGDCGCGAPETDSDRDGTPDCVDGCPDDPAKTEPDTCGCGVADIDTDGDDVLDCVDPCPLDNPDDSDGDGVCDSADPCPFDNPDDTDGDGVCDSEDGCPNDPYKTDPGICGCGVPDDDSDADGVADCIDLCPNTSPNVPVNDCGCMALGACCFPVGVCFNRLSADTCEAIEGVYQGDGSACSEGCWFGDFDADGAVDLRDFAVFQHCFGADETGLFDDLCGRGDIDHCQDIDLLDYDAFSRAMTGP